MRRKFNHIIFYVILSILLPYSMSAQAGLFGPDCDMPDYNQSKKNRHIDQNSAFSVTALANWVVKKKRKGSYSEILLKTKGACKVFILITSRLLERKEKKIAPDQLLAAMLQSSLYNLRSKGQKIISYGKYIEFKAGWPSFVIAAVGSGGKKAVASHGTVVANRNLSVLVVTRNKQHNQSLANILRSTVNSIEIF